MKDKLTQLKNSKPIKLTTLLLFIVFFILFINKPHVILGTFTSIPSSIEGYTCLVFNSGKEMRENKKYLGIGDGVYQFFLFINGKLAEFTKNNDRLVNDQYQLEIDQQSSGVEGYEYYEILGAITVTDIKNNITLTKDFVGYCSW